MLGRIALFAAIAAPPFASLAETPYTDEYATCMEKSGGVTVDMLDCIAAEYEVQDARLNAHYKALSASLTPQRRKALVEAQRLWIRYRDANCGFRADADGGTAAGLMANDCLLTETAERAQELANLRRDD